MQMYPAYTAAEGLRLHAVTFFSLLNEGYRLRSNAALMAAQISALPHMEADQRRDFLLQLEYAAKHPSDILNTEESGSSEAEIKKVLGG